MKRMNIAPKQHCWKWPAKTIPPWKRCAERFVWLWRWRCVILTLLYRKYGTRVPRAGDTLTPEDLITPMPQSVPLKRDYAFP